jgi:hypothetical protein
MKKATLKSLQPQTKSLFRFKNSDSKFKNAAGIAFPTTSQETDPTTTITPTITW